MFIKNIRRIILIFFLFLIITIYIFIKNKNDFHIYYTLRSFVTSDSEYNNLLKNNYLVQEDSKIYNTHNKDFSINWSFRPEHFHPIYPKLIVKDIDKDGIKEIYLASQTKKIYELNSLNGKVKRTWSFPQGQSSSNLPS